MPTIVYSSFPGRPSIKGKCQLPRLRQARDRSYPSLCSYDKRDAPYSEGLPERRTGRTTMSLDLCLSRCKREGLGTLFMASICSSCCCVTCTSSTLCPPRSIALSEHQKHLHRIHIFYRMRPPVRTGKAAGRRKLTKSISCLLLRALFQRAPPSPKDLVSL